MNSIEIPEGEPAADSICHKVSELIHQDNFFNQVAKPIWDATRSSACVCGARSDMFKKDLPEHIKGSYSLFTITYFLKKFKLGIPLTSDRDKTSFSDLHLDGWNLLGPVFNEIKRRR